MLSFPQPARQQELHARITTQLRMRDSLKTEADAEVLRTMLPSHILHRIARGERDIADAHERVTVLFSDVVGFTEMCSRVPTAAVVHALNEARRMIDE